MPELVKRKKWTLAPPKIEKSTILRFFAFSGSYILYPSLSCGLVSKINLISIIDPKTSRKFLFLCVFKIFLVILSSVCKIRYVGDKNSCDLILHKIFTKNNTNYSININFEVVCIFGLNMRNLWPHKFSLFWFHF